MEKRKSAKEINFKYNLKVYWGFLSRYKMLLAGIILLTLILEGIKLVTQFLFREVIDRGTGFAAGTLSLDSFLAALGIIAGIYIVNSIVQTLFAFWRMHGINILDLRLITDIKRKFFGHLLRLDHGFHTTNKTGSIISRLTRSGSSIERMTDVILFNFAPLVLQLVVVSISLAYLSWVNFVVIALTSVLFIAVSMFIQKLQEGPNIEAIDAEDFEKANISDIFTNIDSIKYFGKEKTVNSRFEKISDNTREKAMKHWNYFRWLSAGQTFILSVGTFAILYFSLRQFILGEISLGTVTFIYSVYGGLVAQLFGFVHGVRGFYQSMADFEVLFQYNKIENSIKDKSNAKNLKIKSGEVEFRNVDFHYSKKKLFQDFSLKVPKNKKVALVGHSGCGKTTLVKLLYRFYDVENGEILVDGQNIKNVNQESLRSEMSIVPQECILFDDTIYNNIAFSKPSASRAEVLRAIRFAQLDKIIEDMPLKEKTIVGERGVKLSGGEKQRVSIARAILADKKILVLDEATSALDSETEHEIQKDLARLMEGRTSIIIAHRLSTIMNADKIVVMEKGKVVQIGTHRELIRKEGQYKKLWNLQKGGYIK